MILFKNGTNNFGGYLTKDMGPHLNVQPMSSVVIIPQDLSSLVACFLVSI